ncbi:hypothetical protein FQZ97_1073190 [compost metagenome]
MSGSVSCSSLSAAEPTCAAALPTCSNGPSSARSALVKALMSFDSVFSEPSVCSACVVNAGSLASVGCSWRGISPSWFEALLILSKAPRMACWLAGASRSLIWRVMVSVCSRIARPRFCNCSNTLGRISMRAMFCSLLSTFTGRLPSSSSWT